MQCPYCGREVSDMPNHLRKRYKCHKSHQHKLSAELKSIVRRKKKG